MELVLDVIANATASPHETLRAQCEVREAAHLASDLRSGFERPGLRARTITDRLGALEELVDGHYWWRGQINPVYRTVPAVSIAPRLPVDGVGAETEQTIMSFSLINKDRTGNL